MTFSATALSGLTLRNFSAYCKVLSYVPASNVQSVRFVSAGRCSGADAITCSSDAIAPSFLPKPRSTMPNWYCASVKSLLMARAFSNSALAASNWPRPIAAMPRMTCASGRSWIAKIAVISASAKSYFCVFTYTSANANRADSNFGLSSTAFFSAASAFSNSFVPACARPKILYTKAFSCPLASEASACAIACAKSRPCSATIALLIASTGSFGSSVSIFASNSCACATLLVRKYASNKSLCPVKLFASSAMSFFAYSIAASY